MSLLKSPSSFPNDPRGWTRNQIGHAYLVGAVAVLAGIGGAAILAGYAAWEYVQWRRYQAEAWDCLEDLAHVMIGATVAMGHFEVAAIHAALLVSGYLRRNQ